MIEGFLQYNYIGEVAGLLMAELLLFVMFYTEPKKTYGYRYILGGTILAIIASMLQMTIVMIANNPEDFYNKFVFAFLLIAFLITYNGILFCIFAYVNMMSIVRRSQRKEFITLYIVLSIIYVLGIIFEMAASGLYSFEVNGIDITHFVRYYIAAGMVCAVACFIATVNNKKDISRLIWHSVCIFVPLDMVILITQFITVRTSHFIFSSTTYVPVMAIGFFLFHCIPYDEITGCQSKYALDVHLDKYLGKKNIYVACAYLKMPDIENIINIDNGMIYKGTAIFRNIEAISDKIRIYKIDDEKYVNVIEDVDDETALEYIDRLRGVFEAARINMDIPFNYSLVAGKVIPEFDNILKIRQFFGFVGRRFEEQNSSHFYVTKPKDYDDFAEHYEISKVLKDIKARQDMDDERVVVYAQPIYSVGTGTFRVAEALMRLKVGDRLIYPDSFISIAEQMGAIHVLTCIMLTKVCKEISIIEDYYDFDAISINVSSKELSQANMFDDLMEIIGQYDFDPSNIRLEVTESAMFEDYDIATRNMQELTNQGIQFYLDDFGTGYSSLERVMNCPFKTIKFDKTLLYKALDDDKMDDIVTYMIEVFKKNGFVTLVEGVEDECQNQYSVDHGFEYVQGYHYAKPEPIEEIKKYFTRKSSF